MFKHTLAALVASAFLLTGAKVAFAAPQDEPAPAKKPAARPAQPEWQKAYMAANQALEKKDYETAITEFEKVLGDSETVEGAKPSVAYNIGCCNAMLGKKDKAVEYVVKAIDLGFYDFDHINGDDDLKSVRGDAKIAEAMKRNQAKKDAKDAEAKKGMDETRKKWDEMMNPKLPDALEKVKDPAGAGFDFTFDLKTLDGKPISSKSIAGKVAIVDIWGTWCPPCRMEIPNFVELMKRHKSDDFVLIGLNDEDRKQNVDAEKSAKLASDFAKKNGITYPLALIDTKTIKQVPKFSGYPTTLFIDRTGKVRLVEVGYHPADYMDGIVKELLAEGGAKKGEDAKKPTDGKKANGE
jgi:thiol-disulfide isomerase/thioredoxin